MRPIATTGTWCNRPATGSSRSSVRRSPMRTTRSAHFMRRWRCRRSCIATPTLSAEGKIPVEARVEVNTGEVVRTIETGSHTEYTPVGHVTNLAARMQIAGLGSGHHPATVQAVTSADRRGAVPGESIEIRACAHDLRLQMDPENGSCGTSRGETRQNLSELDSAGSMNVRSRFAFVDRPKSRGTREHTPCGLKIPGHVRVTSRDCDETSFDAELAALQAQALHQTVQGGGCAEPFIYFQF